MSLENGKLVSHIEGDKLKTTLYPEADGNFYIKREAYHLKFIKDDAGKVLGLASEPNLLGFNYSAGKLD